jgi:flagellar biosynthesis/type III secretory pathway protein FliH
MGVISRSDFEVLQRSARREEEDLEQMQNAAREAARQQGYQEGLRQGREEARTAFLDEMDSLRLALGESHAALLEELARLVRTALSRIATLPAPDGWVEGAILDAVQEVGGLAPIRLLVSFEDEAALRAGGAGRVPEIEIAADAQLGPGELILETPRGRHSIGWDAQLAALVENLADDADG